MTAHPVGGRPVVQELRARKRRHIDVVLGFAEIAFPVVERVSRQRIRRGQVAVETIDSPRSLRSPSRVGGPPAAGTSWPLMRCEITAVMPSSRIVTP